jgi:hypothetical protein
MKPLTGKLAQVRAARVRNRRNMRVEIHGIERQHVSRKLKPGNSRFRNCDLRPQFPAPQVRQDRWGVTWWPAMAGILG